jgi:hypothetical protein
MPQELSIVLFFVSCFIIFISSVSIGVGWWVLASSATCTSILRDYVFVVTVASTIELSFCVLFSATILLSYKMYSLNKLSDTFTYFMTLLFFISGILAVIFFFWGIVIFIREDTCQTTPLFGVAIWYVIVGAINLFRTYFVGTLMEQ